jgi:hypothetical protein
MSTTLTSAPPTGAATTGRRFDSAAVVDLAEAVDRDGLDVHAATLSALAERASATGVSPVLVDVMLGAGEPYVARLRAFVRVGQAVVAGPRLLVQPPASGSLAA